MACLICDEFGNEMVSSRVSVDVGKIVLGREVFRRTDFVRKRVGSRDWFFHVSGWFFVLT